MHLILNLGEKIQVLSKMRGNPGIDEVSAKEVANCLWKSTNSEEYTSDSLSD